MKFNKLSVSVLLMSIGLVASACTPAAQQVEVYSTNNPEEDGTFGDTFINLEPKKTSSIQPTNPNETVLEKKEDEEVKSAEGSQPVVATEDKKEDEIYPKCVADKGYYKIGDAYQIDGVWYYPHEEYEYKEEGMASWYGPDFHGKATANSEKFNTLAMTAAHRTLPMPSIVKVTNLENGISAVVKVNDRGPFAKDRIIDLSQKTAEILGMKEKGSALVRVEVLSKESKAAKERAVKCQSTDLKNDIVSKNENDIKKAEEAKPAETVAVVEPVKDVKLVEEVKPEVQKISEPAPLPVMSPVLNDEYPYYVQVGAFVSEIGANKVQSLLKGDGIDAKVSRKITAGENWYKVRVGSFKTKEDALDVQNRINKLVEDTDARVIERTEDDTNSFKWTR